MDTGTIRRVRWVVAALALTFVGAVLAWAMLFGINLRARCYGGITLALLRPLSPINIQQIPALI